MPILAEKQYFIAVRSLEKDPNTGKTVQSRSYELVSNDSGSIGGVPYRFCIESVLCIYPKLALEHGAENVVVMERRHIELRGFAVDITGEDDDRFRDGTFVIEDRKKEKK